MYAKPDVRRFLLIRIVDARTLEWETSRCRSIPSSRGPPTLIIAGGGERRGVPHLTPTWSAALNSDSIYGWTLSLRATPYHCPILSFCHQKLYSCSLNFVKSFCTYKRSPAKGEGHHCIKFQDPNTGSKLIFHVLISCIYFNVSVSLAPANSSCFPTEN